MFQTDLGSGPHGSSTHWYDDKARDGYLKVKKEFIRVSLEHSVADAQVYVTSGKLMELEEEHGRSVISMANSAARQDAWAEQVFEDVPKFI